MSESSATLQRTPLFDLCKAHGGRMVPFAGWEMPVQFQGLLAEHHGVRNQVGLFDVSHMGEFRISGRRAISGFNPLVTGDLTRLKEGAALYTLLCKPDGGIIDDIIVYRLSQDTLFVCVNAANIQKDEHWIQEHLAGEACVFENLSARYAQIAVQGPLSRELMNRVSEVELSGLAYYHVTEAKVLGTPSIVSRTGYTGELGYEIYLPAEGAARVLEGLLEKGAQCGVQLCGLGARDTLRTEVGFNLYGQDMTEATNPFESGIGWAVDLNQEGSFLGKEALLKAKEDHSEKSMRLTGFSAESGPVPRHGALLYSDQDRTRKVGEVTTGTQSPSLQKRIGFCRVEKKFSAPDTELWADVRGKLFPVRLQKRIFYTEGTAKQK